jgi:hypothetical protein
MGALVAGGDAMIGDVLSRSLRIPIVPIPDGARGLQDDSDGCCRDLLTEGMCDLEDDGHPLVLTIMSCGRDWAAGFPNKAEGQRGWRYKL